MPYTKNPFVLQKEMNNVIHFFKPRFTLVYRGDTRPFAKLKNGLSNKGTNVNLNQHVNSNSANSGYISTSALPTVAHRLGGMRSFKHTLLIAALPERFVDVTDTPLVPTNKDGDTLHDYYQGEVANPASIEAEYAVSELKATDILLGADYIGLGNMSLPLKLYSNLHQFAPSAASFQLLSFCPNEAQRYEFELKKAERMDPNDKFVNIEEIQGINFNKIPTTETHARKQVLIGTVPMTWKTRTIIEFALESIAKEEKENKVRLETTANVSIAELESFIKAYNEANDKPIIAELEEKALQKKEQKQGSLSQSPYSLYHQGNTKKTTNTPENGSKKKFGV